jgi:hypothetical protein
MLALPADSRIQACHVKMWFSHFDPQAPRERRRKRLQQVVEESEDEGSDALAAGNADAAGAGDEQHGRSKRTRRVPSHLMRDYDVAGG